MRSGRFEKGALRTPFRGDVRPLSLQQKVEQDSSKAALTLGEKALAYPYTNGGK
jgi:hypothetical protein